MVSLILNSVHIVYSGVDISMNFRTYVKRIEVILGFSRYTFQIFISILVTHCMMYA